MLQATKFCTLVITIYRYHNLDLEIMIVKIVQKILEATNLHFGFGPVFGYLFRFTGLQDRTVLKVILTRCHYMILKFPVKAKLLLKYFELHNHLL